MATSLFAPFAPPPVLSPTIQNLSKPARSLVSPVVFPIIQAFKCSFEAGDSESPMNSLWSVAAIGSWVVVSRASPVMLLFKEGSFRSSRVVLSPIER